MQKAQDNLGFLTEALKVTRYFKRDIAYHADALRLHKL